MVLTARRQLSYDEVYTWQPGSLLDRSLEQIIVKIIFLVLRLLYTPVVNGS